ncbi:hypothetical protein [Ornithinibacillus halotolerans]|uniref:Uncharacterized protein n=1 Tax=Ornithinibacillus halotolerans TaxID=1274357 RepID=A0A916S3M2_9BACI|nr:hypothetical protein [Ornithinibacillus halotolerans]GGA79414.1 hypothetical protein GCM10008025_23530 [Ornithinibacillus halotolerans]
MGKWKWIIGIGSAMLLVVIFFFGWSVIQSKQMEEKSITNYLEWFHQIDEQMMDNEYEYNEIIATVGSESITKRELYTVAAALSSQKLEFETDPTFTPHQIDQPFLDSAYDRLILDSLFICYAKSQQIPIDKKDALDFQQKFAEGEMESNTVNIRAEAIVKVNYPTMFEKEAFGYQALQELVAKELNNVNNRTPEIINKAHEEVLRLAQATCPIEKNSY